MSFQDHRGLRGERADQALVFGMQGSAAKSEHQGVSGRHLGVGVLRSFAPVWRRAGHHGPCVRGSASGHAMSRCW